MPELSILLPTVRRENAEKRIREFAETAKGIDYELVIVSPFPMSGPNVKHVNEVEKRGVIYAMNEAYKASSGRYVACWSDDAKPVASAIANMLKYVKAQPKPSLVGFRKREANGRESEQWQVYGKLYVGWLCAPREAIEGAGGMFDTKFRNYWADPDLSLRAHAKGIPVLVCPDAWLVIDQLDDDVKKGNLSASFTKDTETFFETWHASMDGGKRKEWWRINTPIPYTMSGRLRGVLRQIPFLKELKDALQARIRGHHA